MTTLSIILLPCIVLATDKQNKVTATASQQPTSNATITKNHSHKSTKEIRYNKLLQKQLAEIDAKLANFRSSNFSYNNLKNTIVTQNLLTAQDKANQPYIIKAFEHIKGLFVIADGAKVIVEERLNNKVIVFENPEAKQVEADSGRFDSLVLVSVFINVKTGAIGPLQLSSG